MTALAALIRRDLRIALRVGGGALIGVLFFLTVVVLMPFAVGPDLALLTRLGPGDPLARRAARQPAHARPAVHGRSRGRLARPDRDEPDAAGTELRGQGAGALAGRRHCRWSSPRRCSGLLLNLDAASTSAVALTLLAGTPALTFTGMIGAALAVTLHRGGLLLAVLVLPLSIPVLIFGVAASEAAISGPLAFGTPFSILCALSLISFVIGPFAAAASLRHGLD